MACEKNCSQMYLSRLQVRDPSDLEIVTKPVVYRRDLVWFS